MSLWLPPKVSRELAEKTREHNAGVFRMVQRFHGQMDYWTGELRRRTGDMRLEMIFVPPQAELVGAIPGRYHIMAVIDGGPPALFPITGADGEFCEPSHAVIDRLLESDLQNPRAYRERRRREREAEAERERERERETEERRTELKERYDARFRTQVSLNDSVPWSQNHAGARRPTRGGGAKKAA